MACKIKNISASYADWLNFIHLLGYMYKIRLVSILRKREDQALISMSTILKFSAREKKYSIFKPTLFYPNQSWVYPKFKVIEPRMIRDIQGQIFMHPPPHILEKYD